MPPNKVSPSSEDLLSAGAGIADRIQHLVTKSGGSIRQFSLMCGLPPNSINVTLKRLRSPAQSDPGPSITVALLEKIARSARCNFKWLALGIGIPDDPAELFSNAN